MKLCVCVCVCVSCQFWLVLVQKKGNLPEFTQISKLLDFSPNNGNCQSRSYIVHDKWSSEIMLHGFILKLGHCTVHLWKLTMYFELEK